MFPSHYWRMLARRSQAGVPGVRGGRKGLSRRIISFGECWSIATVRPIHSPEFLRQRDFPIHAATGCATLPPALCLACYLQAAGRYSGGTVPFTISGNPFSGSLLSLQIHFWPVAVANTRVLPIPSSTKPGLTPLFLNFAVT